MRVAVCCPHQAHAARQTPEFGALRASRGGGARRLAARVDGRRHNATRFCECRWSGWILCVALAGVWSRDAAVLRVWRPHSSTHPGGPQHVLLPTLSTLGPAQRDRDTVLYLYVWTI